MPPVRHKPSQRVHDRIFPTRPTLQPTAETSSPFGSAPQNTFQNKHLSFFWNGHQVTPAVHYLLINGVDPSVLLSFNPVLIHDSSRIFDPSTNLPIPPKPNASCIQHGSSAPLIHRAAGVTSDPSLLASPSSSTPSSLAPGPSASKPYSSPSVSPPAAIDTSSIACTYQPTSQPARPPNNFVLFRADYFARVKSLHLSPHLYASLPKVYDQWNQAPESVKAYYRELAGLTKEVHGRLHPGYKYKPLKKDERQRQKDEKARRKRETVATAKANRTNKAQVKSSTTPAAKTASSLIPNAVDFRMYDPARKTYHRHHLSRAQSPPPLPLRPPPLLSPSASSPPPAPSGVQITPQFQDADRLSPSSSPQTTSPACTLFQGDAIESPRLDYAYCSAYEDTRNSPLGVARGLRPTIEGNVDWDQAVSSHWCESNGQVSLGDGKNACDNEINIGIPTALAAPTRHDCYDFALGSNSRMHSLPTIASEDWSFAKNSLEAPSAPTTEMAGDGTMDRFWVAFYEPLHDPPPPLCHQLAPPTVYNECAYDCPVSILLA